MGGSAWKIQGLARSRLLLRKESWSDTCMWRRFFIQHKIKQRNKFFERNWVCIFFSIKKIILGKCSFRRPFIIGRELRNHVSRLPPLERKRLLPLVVSKGDNLPALESWLHSCLAMRPWVSHLTYSLCLSLFIQNFRKYNSYLKYNPGKIMSDNASEILWAVLV